MSESSTPLYSSNFRHTLDDKNRITIPSAWRFTHGENDVLLAVPQPDGYIAVLPPPEAARVRAKFDEIKYGDRSGQDFAAIYFSRAQQMWCDKAGRIGLNLDLLTHAGIKPKSEVVLVGVSSKFFIYTPEHWERVQARTAAIMAETMNRLDI